MIWNWLNTDVISYNKKLTYAKKGDRCTVIERRGNVLICMHENGTRFPCVDSKLSNSKIQKDVETISKHKRKS